MLNLSHILNIKVTTSHKKDIISSIENYLSQKKSSSHLQIFSINPEIIVAAQKNPNYSKILNSGDINLPDGIGIVWALKHLSLITYHLSRTSGIDLMEDLIKLAVLKDYQVAFIGGRDNTAQKALEVLQKKYSGLSGWSQEPLEYKLENKEVGIKNNEYFEKLALRIKQSNVKLVFVGLGAPKQEFFINILHSLFINHNSSLIFMSVGGAFDIISGKLPRAPRVLQLFNLEWLWRLILEPWRIKRQFSLIKFIYLVVRG
jgi:N-acetylglucosaminyldiphosphoundecaprenol N-acetyl-beta-D-mannosaminyltransferase